MKKKINHLLHTLEGLVKNMDQISPITEPYALHIKGGVTLMHNSICTGGTNNVCNNSLCDGSTNGTCNNGCD